MILLTAMQQIVADGPRRPSVATPTIHAVIPGARAERGSPESIERKSRWMDGFRVRDHRAALRADLLVAPRNDIE
ncbi:hypothetical protein XH79_04230 [Bradyrhizobium sp. CCBAU 45389]|nr:hypothetical protein [Bradyrhizobium sp. CCBAU 45389]